MARIVVSRVATPPIGGWCNGSTAFLELSGSGSNPGPPVDRHAGSILCAIAAAAHARYAAPPMRIRLVAAAAALLFPAADALGRAIR